MQPPRSRRRTGIRAPVPSRRTMPPLRRGLRRSRSRRCRRPATSRRTPRSTCRPGRRPRPAIMKLMIRAGPANCAAAVPVMAKMPAPITAPMPSITRCRAVSTRLRVTSPVAPPSTGSPASTWGMDSMACVANRSRIMKLPFANELAVFGYGRWYVQQAYAIAGQHSPAIRSVQASFSLCATTRQASLNHGYKRHAAIFRSLARRPAPLP